MPEGLSEWKVQASCHPGTDTIDLNTLVFLLIPVLCKDDASAMLGKFKNSNVLEYTVYIRFHYPWQE